MGGKTSQSTQQIQIPPEVMARYNAVNDMAQKAAMTPFHEYGGEFVADPSQFKQEVTGMQQTGQYAQAAQPYYQQATGTLNNAYAGTQPVNTAAEMGTIASASPLSGQQIQQYLSPYLNTVLGSQEALQNQQNQQAMAGQLGNAITSGAFGGDRSGIAAANLQQQQNLASANIYNNILNSGYQNALQTAQGQQQIGLAGANQLANIGNLGYQQGANTAQQLGALGTAAQTAGLQGAAANIGAGQLEQQAAQARDTALYNQFQQEQSYPFQTAQFAANIAEGTGALSGSTTTTNQPGGFFSDRRLKEDAEVIGKTFDGQPIYRYKMKGDPHTQIGLMAQNVEKRHPHAVGLAGGYKTVDYKQATDDAANRGHFRSGGLIPESMGGHVGMEHMREGYAYGGLSPEGLAPSDMQAILMSQAQMFAPFSQAGLYGNAAMSGSCLLYTSPSPRDS